MFRIFLGAPSANEINAKPASYSWQTSSSHPFPSKSVHLVGSTQSLVLPRATLEAASHRISLLYKGVIFEDDDEDMLTSHTGERESDLEVSVFRGIEQTTMISWPPSIDTTQYKDDTRGTLAAPSFLLDASVNSLPDDAGKNQLPVTALSNFQETQVVESQSYRDYSDASSIGRFPDFHFKMQLLSSLSQLANTKPKHPLKINVLLVVLEIEGPDTIHIKKGADAGREVSVLKLILGDEEGNVVKLTAWRDVAEEWGGNGNTTATKRGDVVHIENVSAVVNGTSITLTASPYLKSRLVICYRTMPYSHEDGKLRPDLRLGNSEANVRQVATIVSWFERMAGLAT